MTIRELEYEDYDAASGLLWKSFYEAEKHTATMEGMELFRDLTAAVSLSINSMDKNLSFYGVFQGGELSAVGAIKKHSHILLLYVAPERQGCGIGCAFLQYMESICIGDTLTVNSSDFACSFYEEKGYQKAGQRTVENGLAVTPMVKKRME